MSGGNYAKYVGLILVCFIIFSLYTIQIKNESETVMSPDFLSWRERKSNSRNDISYDMSKSDSIDSKNVVQKTTQFWFAKKNLATSQNAINSYKSSVPPEDVTKSQKRTTTLLSDSEKEDVKNVIDNVQKQNLVTSGKLFKGEKIREFPHQEIKFAGKTAPILNDSETNLLKLKQSKNKSNCDKWGVVTTIFEPPSEAVRRLMYRKDWCVVVAGDKGKPSLQVSTSISEHMRLLIQCKL